MQSPTAKNIKTPEVRAERAAAAARARLRVDVAKQSVRLAKEEMKRARKRLKEAKREVRRARKRANAARKAWKQTRRTRKSAVVVVKATGGARKAKVSKVAVKARKVTLKTPQRAVRRVVPAAIVADKTMAGVTQVADAATAPALPEVPPDR